MEDLKHTPGPWTMIYKPNWAAEIVGPNKEDIGFVNVSDGYDDPTFYPTMANAHLIAAAPEMFEALEKAKDAIQCTQDWQDELPILREAVAIIDAALAKARGEP